MSSSALTRIGRERSRRVRPGRALARVGLAVLGIASLTGIPDARAADGRDDPIVMVHGLDAFGTAGVDCASTFGPMRDALKAWGWERSIYFVGYYVGDTGCNATINNDGSHGFHYSTDEHWESKQHDANTDIRHLGYHLAWDIYNRYTKNGYTVDLYGHSMGGLIIRYAIAQVEQGHRDFPTRLYVEDVVTAGTPHGGAGGLISGCSRWQCVQMNPDHLGNDFLPWLYEYAWEPDGRRPDGSGTDWSTFGSESDNHVSVESAVGTDTQREWTQYIGSCHKLWYDDTNGIEHSDYTDPTTAPSTVDYDVWKTPTTQCEYGWQWDTGYYRPVRAADQSLMLDER